MPLGQGARTASTTPPTRGGTASSPEVSLLAVHDALIRLAEVFLGTDDLRLYSAEAWARYTGAAAAPTWYPRAEPARRDHQFAPAAPHLYDHEVPAVGPAGTVVAFELGTFHRGTALTCPRGARYSCHLSFRPSANDWGQRAASANRSHSPAWHRFVERAAPRQLALFGFPPPGHPFWTPATVSGLALRDPGLDVTPWKP
ncbi:hypothetical protein ACFPM7_22605 [Actinokineospora guangxiensis]|uniref:Phytanoyl-CoA dioxygenase PhyH n=1 Tax=Actinokineospora guangxiensis TaxID=1490288 RepID=A0ABW0EUD8_9PSEU